MGHRENTKSPHSMLYALCSLLSSTDDLFLVKAGGQ
jgi:hypothetical protein